MNHRAYIALGANLGDREASFRAALALLATAGVRLTSLSRFFDTAPVGGPAGQPRYLNAAAELATDLAPHALLELLLSVEAELGRIRDPHERNAPRTLDLDLLLYNALVLDGPELTLPHPRMHQRAFVLAPLAEIAPAVRHPRLGKTISELLAALDS